MAECPNCGARITEQDAVCNTCGVSLTGRSTHVGGKDQQNRRQGSQQAQDHGGQPRRSQPRESPQKQKHQQSHEQSNRQPTYSSPNTNSETGVSKLSRRQTLIAGGVGIAALGGGAFVFLGGRGPKETVTEFFSALDNGNRQKANSMIHPNSPIGEVGQNLFRTFENASFSVQNPRVEDKSGDTATVVATLNAESAGRSTQMTNNLRKHNGEWKIYDGEMGSSAF